MENDFKEQGERALLNMGHTLGHAIEKYVYMDRLHGECVSIGMAGAAYISYKKGYITQEGMDIRTIVEDMYSRIKFMS